MFHVRMGKRRMRLGGNPSPILKGEGERVWGAKGRRKAQKERESILGPPAPASKENLDGI